MRSLFFSLLLFAVAIPVQAESDIIAAPEKLESCVVCHGIELRGNPLVNAPNLSVLPAWYVERQLLNFRKGLRAPANSPDLIGQEMQVVAMHLDEANIRAAINFVAKVPEYTAPPTTKGDSKQGEEYYQTCAACHGQYGEGNSDLNAPRLVGQSDWYLIRQLENFKAGTRGVATADIWGEQMRLSASVLEDEKAIRDVVSYINALKPHNRK